MSALIPDYAQGELDNKKRKVRIVMGDTKKDSDGFLKVKGKGLKSPPMHNAIPQVVVDLMDPMCIGKLLM